MAVISKVQIANMALTNIGSRNTIESLTENSVEAKTCNIWYDHSRLTTLEAYDWNFARKRVTLAEDSEDAPEEDWAFRYQYPADCVKARELVNYGSRVLWPYTQVDRFYYQDADAIPFEIEVSSDGERKTLLTNMEDAILIYTFDQENVTMYPRSFITALSYCLAMDIAFTLTGKLSVRETMMQHYRLALSYAAAHDANERVDAAPRDVSWIRGRR